MVVMIIVEIMVIMMLVMAIGMIMMLMVILLLIMTIITTPIHLETRDMESISVSKPSMRRPRIATAFSKMS